MIAVVAVLIVAVCVAIPATALAQSPLRVGSKAFTEGIILGEIVTRTAETAGASVKHLRSLGGTQILWKALVRGDIDIYVEYTGTISEEIFGRRVGNNLDSLKVMLGRERVRLMAPLGFNNTYALGMREQHAQSLRIETISDLKSHPTLRFGLSNEFLDRNDGWPGLHAAYSLPHETPRGLDHDLAYRALEDNQIDIVDLYSTDAEIDYYRLRVLRDDKPFFPRYEAVVLYRSSLDSTHPRVVAALASLSRTITDSQMIAMNAAVKLKKVSEDRVAAEFIDAASAEQDVSPARAARTGVIENIAAWTLEHLTLVSISLLAAIAVGIPLGVLSARRRHLGQFVLSATSIVYTIPSLALLVVMIPLLGIGTAPVLAALFLYSLLPIVRNTYTGLTGISSALVESAIAMGISRSSRLRRIELPLALPTILAGVKTAAVMNVATATIGALIGAGGYGQPILTGIRLDDMGLILQGAVPAAVLA